MRFVKSEWFAARVKSRTEDVVSKLLACKGYTTYVPRSGGNIDRKSSCRPPLLPGYVLCRSDHDTQGLVVTTPFVMSVVKFGEAVAHMSEAEIDHLRSVEVSRLPSEPWARPATGVPIRITAGPLAGVEGHFLRVAHRRLFLIAVEVLQRAISVEMDPASVKWSPLGDARMHLSVPAAPGPI